jgi:hypothetical protein
MVIQTTLLLLAAEVSYDGWSTQYLRSKGYTELDPLAAPLVNKGTWGQVAASTLGWVATAVPSLLLYHYNHPLPGTTIAVIVAVAEGINCIRQATIVAKE